MKPEEFEQKIAWIEFLLKGKEAKVKWDEKIPDPDNPEQPRQIDIAIKRGKHLTLVECRLHSRPQDVTWIEGLIGRRISLNAYSGIAVSASGFTVGAKKKAEKHGIILRDFKSLTEEEVKEWGVPTSVYLDYVSFCDTILYLVTESSALYNVAYEYSLFKKADGSPWPLDSLFKSTANLFYKSNRSFGSGRVQLFTKDLFHGGREIKEVILQTNYKKREFSLNLPAVSIYGTPKASMNERMYIEGQQISNFEIYQYKKSAFAIVDFSVVPPLDHSVFLGIRFDFKRPVSLSGVKIIGQKLDTFYVVPFEIKQLKKDSALYRRLLSNKDTGLILP